jgi:hypothetical protein
VVSGEGIPAEELAKMVENSAITRVRGFNRRYFHWLFSVQGDSLLAMQRFEYAKVGKGDSFMYEDHGACDGRGCKACGWIGQVKRWVKDKPVPTHGPLVMRKNT